MTHHNRPKTRWLALPLKKKELYFTLYEDSVWVNSSSLPPEITTISLACDSLTGMAEVDGKERTVLNLSDLCKRYPRTDIPNLHNLEVFLRNAFNSFYPEGVAS